MEIQDILSRCDHTLLRTDCTAQEIRTLCDQGIRYGVASVCIPPAHVAGAKRYVGDKLRLCTVIGFPNGYATTRVKAFEADDAIRNGADEIDMVVNLGMVRDRARDEILDELRRVRMACGEKILKVIIECCLLTEEEKRMMCALVSEARADYIKTSTGFSTGGATFEDVELLRQCCDPAVKVKAAGGIRDLDTCLAMVEAGAERIGTSAAVKITEEFIARG